MPSTTTSRKQERRAHQHDVSRNQLLDAAEEVFGTKGYHDTTLREVAELAEFSVGSVYSFFDSKDDLFLKIFLRRGDQFVEGLKDLAALDSKPVDPESYLRRLVEYEVDFFRDHPHFGRLYLRTASLAQPLPTRDDRGADAGGVVTFEAVMAIQGDVFRSGQQAGVFRAGDPAALVGILSGMVTAFLALDPTVVTGGVDTSERLTLEDLTEMVVAAFRA